MGDIRFAICPAVRERKTEVAGQESSAVGSRGRAAGGRENGRENRPVPSAAIDFARMQLHMQPPCIHLSRPSRFAGPARASERAAIN